MNCLDHGHGQFYGTVIVYLMYTVGIILTSTEMVGGLLGRQTIPSIVVQRILHSLDLILFVILFLY